MTDNALYVYFQLNNVSAPSSEVIKNLLQCQPPSTTENDQSKFFVHQNKLIHCCAARFNSRDNFPLNLGPKRTSV